jgi:SWIM zinc finger
MTQEQLEVRKERAEKEVFVITAGEEGWRVRSARNPSRCYLVSGNESGLQCSCPDFQQNAQQDPAWQCKHILAVQGHQAKTGAADPQAERELAEERAAIQAEASPEAQPANGAPTPAQMLIKRSISPDGRIDSISIEFSFALTEATVGEIKNRALRTLKLQTEIVKGFLANNPGSKTNPGGSQQPPAGKPNGATFARLLDVGVSNGQYGERFYLNFQVNGRRARFFGTAGQLARAIYAAGERIPARELEPGLRLDLPCRVYTQESADGRYLNVTRVLPTRGRGNGGANQ